jgi:hypothetical protein
MDSITLPPLSANSLFHFTDSLENLVNILTNEFRPKFCLEDFSVLRGSTMAASAPDEEFKWAVPMVCFCDLPLSQTSYHLSIYGNYGIGLTKEWGRRKGISPLMYVYSDSLLTVKLIAMIDRVMKNKRAKRLGRELIRDFNDIFSFVKPYEGDFWRRGVTIPNVRFYNEREWRFVPSLIHDDPNPWGLTYDVFLDDEKRKAANDQLAQTYRISFEPNDIKYLVVGSESEIVPLISQIETIKGRYSYDDVRLLFSRVISAEQIRHDF